MAEEDPSCPVCGERLAIRGLSFFMVSVVVQKHSQAGPKCNLRITYSSENKEVKIERETGGKDAR